MSPELNDDTHSAIDTVSTTRTMRITCVIHSLAGGGAERLMAGLTNRLASQHMITLVTLDESSTDRYSVDPKVKRIGLGLMGNSKNLITALGSNRRRIKSLRDAVLASNPEVVLSFCDKTNILTLSSLIRARSETGKLPIIISEHTNPDAQPIGPIWSWLRRRLYPQAAAAIALTAPAASTIRDWTRGRVEIIPPAIEPPPPPSSKFQPINDSASTDAPFVWLCLGRLANEKQFHLAISAFDQVAGNFDCKLLIAGDGPLKERLQNQIRHTKHHNKIELLGWVQDTQSLLDSADGFLLTSAYEGFPVALLEAMAAGLCCLSVDCNYGPKELIDSDVNGVLVSNNNIPQLSTAIREIMAAPVRAKQLGERARDSAAQYSWERFVDAHEKLLLSVLAH